MFPAACYQPKRFRTVVYTVWRPATPYRTGLFFVKSQEGRAFPCAHGKLLEATGERSPQCERGPKGSRCRRGGAEVKTDIVCVQRAVGSMFRSRISRLRPFRVSSVKLQDEAVLCAVQQIRSRVGFGGCFLYFFVWFVPFPLPLFVCVQLCFAYNVAGRACCP